VSALLSFRRGFAAAVASLIPLLTVPSFAQSDRGIGGTGATQDEADPAAGRDRGIGGTGVIGTIRGFGSIVVNGVHISYPRDAAVRTDGQAGTTADLQIGQVVRVVAQRQGGRLATRSIEITSEVVGPVETVSRQTLTVAGQTVSVSAVKGAQAWRVGDVVAVSGLRRPDGTIVASLVQRRSGDRVRIAGVAAQSPDGVVRIGGARLVDVAPALVGKRVILEGVLVDGAVRVAAAQSEQEWLSRAARFSIESYVERGPAGIRLGSGVQVSGGAGARMTPGRAALAVVTGTARPGGALVVDGVRLEEAVGAGRPGVRQRSLLDAAPGLGRGQLDPRTLPLDLRPASPGGLTRGAIDRAGGAALGLGSSGALGSGIGAATGGALGGAVGGVGGAIGGVGGAGGVVGGAAGGALGLPTIGAPAGSLGGGLLGGRR
jgi:hypothetical protein